MDKVVEIFAYGSLMNLESASHSLKRAVERPAITTAVLKDYRRSWTYWATIYSHTAMKSVKGVFLNVEQYTGATVNGVVFQVDQRELEYLKQREINYECRDVTDCIHFLSGGPRQMRIFTFVGVPDFLVDTSPGDYCIFKEYINVVEAGLNELSDAFRSEFYTTTLPTKLPLIEGKYTFEKPGS